MQFFLLSYAYLRDVYTWVLCLLDYIALTCKRHVIAGAYRSIFLQPFVDILMPKILPIKLSAVHTIKQESLAKAKVSARQPWYLGRNSLNRPPLRIAQRYQRNL